MKKETSTSEEAPKQQIREISLIGGVVGGCAAFLGGMLLSSTAHYVGTAKSLQEEGINPQTRLKALPMALKALTFSTLVCGCLGGVTVAALHFSGVSLRPVAEVSFQEAVRYAQQQRDIVRSEFQSKLQGQEQDPG